MQDAHVVGGRHRLGDVDQQADAGLQGDLVQPSLGFGPLEQVGAAVFAFQEERGRVEVPFQHADKIRPFAQRFLQEAGRA